MPLIEPLINVKSVNIDFPFVQPGDFRADGKLSTSFDTVKEMIDRAIQLGFDTVSFDTNVPINAQTGELQLFVAGDGNGDKRFPEAIWEGIAYAESKGLKTIIDLIIRNVLNDVPIMKNNVGSGFNESTFFETVKNYETEIAKKAALYGVDGIRIGSYNFGYVSGDYADEWASVIDSIRSVYKGTLGYQTNVEDSNNVVLSLVDEVQFLIPPVFPLKSYYTKAEIAPLYLSPYMMANGQVSNESIFSLISNLAQKYPDKILSLEVSFQPGQSAGQEYVDPWGYVFAEDPLLDNAKDQNSLVPFPESWIDPELNQQKIAGFFEFFGNYLEDTVSGIQYYQYAPWTEADWIRNPSPQNLTGQAWNSVVRAGLFLNYSPESESVLTQYLLKDWGFNKLHYGTDNNDYLRGSELEDIFYSSQGDDTLDGGAGIDIAQYLGTRSKYDIQKFATEYQVTDLEGSDGTDRLSNVERLQFSDASLALDLDGNAGQAYRIYKAAFDRDPMQGDTEGLGYWIAQIDRGMDLIEVSARFIDSKEFRDLYGSNPSNGEFLTKLYQNALVREPDAGGYNWWLNQLNTNPEKTKAKVLADFAESEENQLGVLELIGNGITYEPWVG